MSRIDKACRRGLRPPPRPAMTDAEKNRAVAKELGQRAHYYGDNPQPYLLAKDGTIGDPFNPLGKPAQCIEALDRKFTAPDGNPSWRVRRVGGSFFVTSKYPPTIQVGSDPDPVRAFCAAGVAAILAAREGDHA